MSARAVVAHAGSRDHYQLALALHEAGHLADLVTEAYVSPRLVGSVRKAGARRLADIASKRSCPGLEIGAVRMMPLTFAQALSTRWRTNPSKLWSVLDARLGTTALRRARATASDLYLYSYYAHDAFIEARKHGVRRILFQLHPHPAWCKRILDEELLRVPGAAASLLAEKEMSISGEDLYRLSAEPALAEHVVVASSFTKRTLVAEGIDAERIAVVPYGVDARAFPARIAGPPTQGPLQLVFVGSFVQRKGISYLLDAVNSFPANQVRLVVATRSIRADALPPGADGDNVEFRLGLGRAELLSLLHRSDVFVMPSLIEGFGLAILEAMSAGLPVIATANSCAADIVDHGVDGFVVPIRSSDAISEAIQACLDDRAGLFDMGRRAAAKAQMFSWKSFRNAIVDDYRTFHAGPPGR